LEHSLKEIVLITLTGPDRKGVTQAITEILAAAGLDILDIGQSVIHENLVLGMMVQLPNGQQGEQIKQQIQTRLQELSMTANFAVVDEASYQHWVSGQGKDRYILTLLARRVTAEHITRVTEIISGQNLNIDDINRLSGRLPLEQEARIRYGFHPDRSRSDRRTG
jgi:phosphoserine phosphatase